MEEEEIDKVKQRAKTRSKYSRNNKNRQNKSNKKQSDTKNQTSEKTQPANSTHIKHFNMYFYKTKQKDTARYDAKSLDPPKQHNKQTT